MKFFFCACMRVHIYCTTCRRMLAFVEGLTQPFVTRSRVTRGLNVYDRACLGRVTILKSEAFAYMVIAVMGSCTKQYS